MAEKFSLPTKIKGFLLLSFALLLFLSFLSFSSGAWSHNILGFIGYCVAGFCLYLTGLSAFLIPIYLAYVGKAWLFHKTPPKFFLKTIFFVVLILSLSMLLVVIGEGFPRFAHLFKKWTTDLGGVPLHHFYANLGEFSLKTLLGKMGTFLVSAILFVTSIALLAGHIISRIFFSLKPKSIIPIVEAHQALNQGLKEKIAIAAPPPRKKEEPKQPLLPPKMRTFSSYTLPSSNLLTSAKKGDPALIKNDLKELSKVLEETFSNFGIEAKLTNIQVGPTVISFEVQPAVGVKVQKIKALEDDIALNMQAKSIRIIAPIPGKAAVGIEVANPHPQEVGFRDLVESYHHSQKKCIIPLLLGKGVNGEEVWADLTKMPHMIIAGATGSGKSVCINTIVMSILMNAHPSEIKMLMIDPKKVELTAYSKLPHMLAPVITEPREAHAAFIWLVKEMERRYEMFRRLGLRNITGFNERKIDEAHEQTLGIEIPKELPYIVGIVDELADLMMVSDNDIETPIARIAQMARAVGIHLILATQRPSREVITGLIKANFPTRISFKVANRVNSQIVLDENGAESLLGNGDMLFMPPGTSFLSRAQGAFVRDDDIQKVIDFICNQMPADYMIPSFKDFKIDSGEKDSSDDGEGDSLYKEAKAIVLETGNASTTFLQRKLKIGYARAAGLMDELEANQIVGPQEGAKPRKIYYPTHND